jgi:lipoprotein-anchoring transpeptidase ErfK/SrfK
MDDKLHELRLDDLKQDSDGILALRMVKGFYVAVDRTFHWHGRTWYKTTKGLVAPADRMGQASPSDFHGVELGADLMLPVGWVYGGREKTQSYEIDVEKKRAKPVGTVARFQPIALADATQEIGGTVYRQMKDGKWVKQAHLRVPEPGPAPTELRPGERWVDVDLSTQTLVVFEGNTPIYATLVSTGKSSKIKDKDHSTPTGQWRIREKHISTTMDGDGTAAGDQPYSIEDVPFVMYFNKSYAIHAAFWHRNYGVQMSHGCVNLAPLDAKAVFSKTEPSLPSEWHGAWSSASRPGSWVSVHE